MPQIYKLFFFWVLLAQFTGCQKTYIIEGYIEYTDYLASLSDLDISHNYSKGIPFRFCYQSSNNQHPFTRSNNVRAFYLAWPTTVCQTYTSLETDEEEEVCFSNINKLANILYDQKKYEIYSIKKNNEIVRQLTKKPRDPNIKPVEIYSKEKAQGYLPYVNNLWFLESIILSKKERKFLNNAKNIESLKLVDTKLKNTSLKELQRKLLQRIILSNYRFGLRHSNQKMNEDYTYDFNTKVYRAYIRAEVYLNDEDNQQLILTKAPIEIKAISENPPCVGQFWENGKMVLHDLPL